MNNGIGSNGELDDAFILVTFNEVVDEICIEQGLYDACDERGQHQDFPVVDPK